jgi:hypothetical protein
VVRAHAALLRVPLPWPIPWITSTRSLGECSVGALGGLIALVRVCR